MRFRVPAISETACLGTLTTTGLLERVVATSDLNGLIRKTAFQCPVEKFYKMTADSVLVRKK